MCGTDKSAGDFELVLDRLIDAPREAVYRAFTEPALLEKWFVPKPWTVSNVQLNVRPGGIFAFVMHGPNGEEFPNSGVYLEVIPNEKLVTTDAYIEGWHPSAKPFMTTIITFADEGGKTRYIARVRHWSEEDRSAHEAMGFYEGWGKCADQLEDVAQKIERKTL